MKRINNEQILDRIYDLADSLGMRIDDFIMKLEDDYGEENLPQFEGLPEEIEAALKDAKQIKKEQRKQARLQKDQEEIEAEIKKFREIFPDVAADDIPDEVWADVENGATLSQAYALYKAASESLDRYAKGINDRNARMGAKAVSDGSTEPVFTKELVEKMSDKEIKNNYKGILKSMKNWRFN